MAQRVKPLFEEVIQRLPDEEQFQIEGHFIIHYRKKVIEYWKINGPSIKLSLGTLPDFTITKRDGNCAYLFRDSIENSIYYLTIVLDKLSQQSDDYIKGLYAHEFAELSLPWRTIKEHENELQKLEPLERNARINQLTKKDAQIGTSEYQEHENLVNQEAIRLGFEKEIKVLESQSGY